MVTIDEDGNLVGIDIHKAEKELGDSPELELVKEEVEEQEDNMQPMINPDGPINEAAPMRNCLNKKISNEWNSYITGAVASNIIDAVLTKNYKKGAKFLIKNGVKGSRAGIIYTLGPHWVACYNEVD